MIAQSHINLVVRIANINADKQEDTFLSEMQEMYRKSIKFGKRREFINQVRKDAMLIHGMTEQDHVDLYIKAGDVHRMATLAELLAEYVEFQQWLGVMIGDPI